jgi:anti-sigma-K factor RskA
VSVRDRRVGDGDCGGNAAPYVLGALTEVEHEAFAQHLVSCAVCREEVAALQTVAASLPAAVPQLEAPAELKKRVMAAVQDDAQRARASQTSEVRERTLTTSRRWRPALVPAAIALASTIALAIVLASGSGSGAGSHLIRAQVSAHGASASVLLSGGHAQLTLTHMPPSGPGRVYEVWIERTGAPAPTDTLFTVTSGGSATVGVPGNLVGVKEVLVTSEPLGGSLAPTTTPVVLAKLA